VEEKTTEFKDILRTIRKSRKLIASIFCGAVLVAVLVNWFTPPTYEAVTSLRIKQPKGLSNSLMTDAQSAGGNTMQLMSTYAEILKSQTILETVIAKTKGDKAVVPSYGQLVGRITTVPVKDTEILKVRVTASSPEEAQLVTNTLVETFNERMTFLVRSEQTAIREFLGKRMNESQKTLEQAETVLGDYKREHKISAPDVETKAMVDKFATVDKLAAENAVALASAQASLGTASQQLSAEKPGFVADSPLIQQYKTKLGELDVKLVSLSTDYTDKHPEVITTRAAIAETKGKLNQEIDNVINANAASSNPIHQGLVQSQIKSEVEIAARQAQKQALQSIDSASQQKMTQLPAKEQGLAKVMRDVSVNQEIYTMLAKRHEEARISEVMQPIDVQVIDAAFESTGAISPNKNLNLVIAAFLGLFIGLVIAFVREYMDKTIRTADDVQRYLGLPVAASIPDFDTKITLNNKSSLWEKLKSLITTKKGGSV